MIANNEYLEIKEFLQHKVIKINHLENEDRKKQRENATKYSLPKATSFGWMPGINLCYSFDIGNKQIMYVLPYLPFYNFLTYTLPQALYKYPDLFGTKDAKDVILAIYKISGYDKIGSINDYQQLLIDNACCYFLLRNECGNLTNKVFRLDLFRHILNNNKNGHDFNGGLMHAFRHCSWHGMKLSCEKGETELNSLWNLPLILGKAILTANDSANNSSTTFEDEGKIWQIKYFMDSETGVYYLKTAFAKK